MIEELVTNSLRHGGKAQDLALLLTLKADGDGHGGGGGGAVTIKIEDDGPAFDPLTAPPITGPDPTTGGGIGLAIVNAWGENAVYSRVSQNNVLRLTLR